MSGMYHPLPKTVRVELGRATRGGGRPEPGGEPGLQDGVLREAAMAELREAGALRAVEGGISFSSPGAWVLELEGEAGLGHFLSLMSDPQQDWETAMEHVAPAL